ncbi:MULTISPECIES: HAMP domain-containing sensor histidine kinase [unclassified Dietzia]|uniref:HAMP domain-containing sensor histidine kinase n=1 Tax=unclassified Dietzia TaxID=2617939 RepID=UPI000D215D9E|nr:MULTISPECIES: HAMP domain-containing sensor histidine kinase [unclassified Dietzia]AVZ39957.1 two-component sensor histidine kinase [Dietzia sp. JS16-p6b]MBB1024559.1 HAMP domain-containing histidine kinase [Dietzia sp. DQ12-76]MBB1028358.1 HAMP domain-containing histidine kinase [Dietzia sp. DQ11-38-2]QGW25366.1 two-component histidine kinase MprB [Dietzia sp. DQ12-45-1b]
MPARTVGWSSTPISLHQRVTLLAASSVGVAVALMAVAAYFVVSGSMYSEVNNRLQQQADQLVNSQLASEFALQSRSTLIALRAFNPNLDAQIVAPSGVRTAAGEPFQIGGPEIAVVRGETDSSLRTAGGKQIYAVGVRDGSTLILAQDLSPTRAALNRLAIVLTLVGAAGIALAAVAGTAVGRTGLAPVARLTRAVERIARTDDLRPIPVAGDDEIARLTASFNQMLVALGESRERQSRLVADAGHELKTPLTSLRTNVELLIAASRPGAPTIPDADRGALEVDVVGQISELTQLVGDLVELAREDSGDVELEPVAVSEAVERALERVRRRRHDVHFDVELAPWYSFGDSAGIERAVLNICDNAAKWSPTGGTVTVRMNPVSESVVELTVADQGPGIPEADKELVFERFHRSREARAMPGSGLGLAIVRQVVTRHGGTVEIHDADGGGTEVRMTIPGSDRPPS